MPQQVSERHKIIFLSEFPFERRNTLPQIILATYVECAGYMIDFLIRVQLCYPVIPHDAAPETVVVIPFRPCEACHLKGIRHALERSINGRFES